MANLDVSDALGIVDRRRGRGTSNTHTLNEISNTSSVAVLRTRLTAISATKYTAARLDAMTKNDMLYALRVETSDSAGI